jgi:hypothetical protein
MAFHPYSPVITGRRPVSPGLGMDPVSSSVGPLSLTPLVVPRATRSTHSPPAHSPSPLSRGSGSQFTLRHRVIALGREPNGVEESR